MIKISKKISVIVILAVMVVLIFGFGGLMKFSENMNSKDNGSSAYSVEIQKEQMKSQLEDAKTKLSEVEKQKASATGDELIQIQSNIISYQNQVDMLQYAIDNGIILNTDTYLSQAVQILFSNKETVSQLSIIPAAGLAGDQKAQLSKAQNNVSTFEDIIKNKDFKKYISYLNEQINSNTAYSDDEKKIYLESNNLRLKYNITGEVDGKPVNGNANQYIYNIENGKMSLLKDLDYTGSSEGVKPLTDERRESIKNSIAVNEYKFEKGIVSNTSTNNFINDAKSMAFPYMLSIVIFMVVILVMILAGGSISSEISTGSIKSLIISPTKRWKIFAAKFLSLLTVGIITALIGYIFSIIANGIFFGLDSGIPYVYAKDGVAHEIGFYLYQLARLCTDFIEVIVFMTFAFMLSIITRNTAVSVAITIGVYFVGSTASTIVTQLTKGDWRKFIPFNNLAFTSKIFPNDTISQAVASATAVHNSLLFQSIYIAILVICMGYIGLDSFNRRDIK
jgi:ABC-type transport system involved in multi-copper enzyme maturation permease subunit